MTLTLGSGRALTVLAVGFLLLDGALLGLAGLWAREPTLIGLGLGMALMAGLVGLLWQRHRRRMGDIETARREVREEVQALRELVKKR